MPGRSHLPAPERRAVSRLHALLQRPGLLHGSLQVNRRKCGKKNCHCAKDQPHTSLYLSVVVQGRQHAFGVPLAWEPRLREWTERDREIRKLLLEISAEYLARFREGKG